MVIVKTTTDRQIWQERDGRWLGSEFRYDTWYEPFSQDTENMPVTENITATAAFACKEDAQQWIREFDNAKAVAAVKAAGGTKLVFA